MKFSARGAKMEEPFLKSAFRAAVSAAAAAAAEPFPLDDTSLALPAEPGGRSPDTARSDGRSLRVQQQVQLTLARKARRTLSNGGVHLQRSTGTGFDAAAADGHLHNIKANGFTNYCFSGGHMRRPSRRVEVSPPVSPGIPRSRFNYSTLRFGTQTHPGPGHGHRAARPQERALACDSFRRYAFSEAPHGTRAHMSVMRQMSVPPAPRPAYANAAFHRSGDHGSRWSRGQTAVRQERGGEVGMTGAGQPDDGAAWLAQVRRNAQALRRLNSYPPSGTSVDVDVGRQAELELPVQQIHGHSLGTLKSERSPEMTVERAVGLLTQDNEDTLIYAASHIQNQCFKSAQAKKLVCSLRGIRKLLLLLDVDNEEVQRVAAGALRNLVYQSNENKMEVKDNEGLATVLSALKASRDVETRRQLTGLLWNLSSHDLVKERLSREALSVLTKYVLVPSSGVSEGENPKDELLADDEVFHHATGCLRNLSSAGPDGRKAMRHCENLIDSLVYYVRGTIADYKTDDKSTENCVCILHNLSYQMEAELPVKYARELRESRLNLTPLHHTSVSCFPQRSARISQDLERQCPLLEEKSNPRGVEWLWSAITVRMYLSLIARNARSSTQEAAVGALQNITAGAGAVSEALASTIVQRENGLQHVQRILQEGDTEVKRTAVSLLRNLSRHQELQPDIVRQVLPEVVVMLPNDDTGAELPADATAALCHVLVNLSRSSAQHVRAIVNQGALPKIINISRRDNGAGPSRAGQVAGVLLQTMWRHSDLHGSYRKCGFRKSDFVNARTTRAVNSSRN